MRVPISWLKEYIKIEYPIDQLAHKLTMGGLEVGEIITLGNWGNCLVGLVSEVNSHPNADNLKLCKVSAGNNEIEVVCGAPNVSAGQKVCLALVGSYLYNTHSGKHEHLKSSRIRGIVSEGMICSEVELGLGNSHDGIVVLPDNAPLGMNLDEYLGDTILDIELTPNRLDCFSILGVAHEIAAHTKQIVREPQERYSESETPIDNLLSVSVIDTELCPRYTASVISGVQVTDSPKWIQDRLHRSGLRPINNIVDITNYVMLEFNQPLHAFDLDALKGNKIIVRRANKDEYIETLDGISRELEPEMLVIADSIQPVGLAGVIGGLNSEIKEMTQNIVLESATFSSANNRRTATHLKLHTEATLRFEKGLRPELAPIALNRAIQLIQELCGGEVAKGIIDIYPNRQQSEPFKVTLRLERLKQVLGMEISVDKIEEALNSLGFKTSTDHVNVIEAEVPYWRNDVNIEEDLIEEIIRIIGYDVVPSTMIASSIPYHRPNPITETKDQLKDILASLGMQEVISYPLSNLVELQDLEIPISETPPLRLANPMSSDLEYLRPTLRGGLLSTLAYNQGHYDGPIKLFECSRVFLTSDDGQPYEREEAAGVLAGPRFDPSWLGDQGSLDFFDTKSLIVSALQSLKIDTSFDPWNDSGFQMGRCAKLTSHGLEIGLIGEVNQQVGAKLNLKPIPTILFELYVETISEISEKLTTNFQPFSRYPQATRDLAIIVPADITAEVVKSIISRSRLVQRIELFDTYSGDNIPKGTRSLAFHIYFQSMDHTLTTKEVDRTVQGILRILDAEVGGSLRV